MAQRTIQTAHYPGSIDQFHAFMDRLIILHGRDEWLSSEGAQLVFQEEVVVQAPPTRRSWEVYLRSSDTNPIPVAGIEAFQETNECTRIDFIDGYMPGTIQVNWRKCIGPAFEELAQMIIDQFPRQADTSTDDKTHERSKRGTKVGTHDRVREAHRLLKGGMGVTKACKQAHTDTRTYYQRCEEATGEEPIVPYENT